jgi:hypothetical protein
MLSSADPDPSVMAAGVVAQIRGRSSNRSKIKRQISVHALCQNKGYVFIDCLIIKSPECLIEINAKSLYNEYGGAYARTSDKNHLPSLR